MTVRGTITIKSKRPGIDIQGVGCRVFIAQRILLFPESQLKAIVVNDREDKKIVHVNVEGEKKAVERLLHILKDDLQEKFGNPGIEMGFSIDSAVSVPPRTDLTQGLVLAQLEKGIDAQLLVLKKLEQGNEAQKETTRAINSLPPKIADSQKETIKAIDSLPPKITRGITQEFKKGQKEIVIAIDALPLKIAEAMKGSMKSG